MGLRGSRVFETSRPSHYVENRLTDGDGIKKQYQLGITEALESCPSSVILRKTVFLKVDLCLSSDERVGGIGFEDGIRFSFRNVVFI
jgi:hypothetical protein